MGCQSPHSGWARDMFRNCSQWRPHANNFTTQTNGGDGLNTAVDRYLRPRQFRQQLRRHLRHCHNRIVFRRGQRDRTKTAQSQSGFTTSTARIVSACNTRMNRTPETTNVAPYEDGYSGHSRRRPALLTVNGTSTLSPNLVNEARLRSELQS